MIEALSLILLNLIIYYQTIKFSTIMDDTEWFTERKREGLWDIRKVRKLSELIGWINHHFYSGTTFGTNPREEHIFAIFLHTLVCILIYIAFGGTDISFWAAVFYCTNPANNQTAIWLNGRRYIVNIIGVLLMVMVYPHGIAGKICALCLYLMTGLFHMTAIFSPVLFGWKYLLLFLLMGILFRERVLLVIKTRFSNMNKESQYHFPVENIIVIIKSFGWYFFKMIVPGRCALIYPDLWHWRLTKGGNENAYAFNADFVRGCLALVVCGGVLFILPSVYKGWFIFAILAVFQWCNIIPVLQVLADRYTSVSTPFMMFFLSYFLHMTGIFYVPLVFLIFGYYWLCLSVVMPMYRDLIGCYNYHIGHFPAMPSPRADFITALVDQGHLKEAEYLVHGGLVANPTDYSLLVCGAVMCLLSGKVKEGRVFLENAEMNFYIGRDEAQRKEIEDLRVNFNDMERLAK